MLHMDPSPALSRPAVPSRPGVKTESGSHSGRAVSGRRVDSEAVVIQDKESSHFPRQVFYPTSKHTGKRKDKTPTKKTRSKSPVRMLHSVAKKSRPDSNKRAPKVPKLPSNIKAVSSTSSKSAEKVTSAEMMQYLDDIPKILQAREERKSSISTKPNIQKDREIRERRKADEIQLKLEIQRRKDEISKNNLKIRQMTSKARSRKRSLPSDNRIDYLRDISEGRKKTAYRGDKTPPSAKKIRSLSEEKVKPEELVEYLERRKIVMKEGKKMTKLSKKPEEGKKAAQLKELDKLQKDRLAEYKKGKKKGKKRGKKPQQRTKSSDVLPWEGSPGSDQIHSSTPNLLSDEQRDFSLYQPDFQLPDKHESGSKPPFFFANFVHSPKLPQIPDLKNLKNPGNESIENRPETSTADFPLPSSKFPISNHPKLTDLHIKPSEISKFERQSEVGLIRSMELKELIREEAAVKIQSHVRRFLTQKRLEEMMKSGEYVKNEVRNADFDRKSSKITLKEFEERVKMEQEAIAKATEEEIALLREQNRKLAEEQRKLSSQFSEDQYVQMLQTAKQQEMQQFQELLQTKCGSRVDLVEEMSMAFENMLEFRFRQLVLLFSQNREKIQAALKTIPSDLDISSTFTHSNLPPKEENPTLEEENPGQDLSLDAFIRKALGTEETGKIETEAANQAAEILTEAKRQAEDEYLHFDPYSIRPENPFPEDSEDERPSSVFISPDLSVIQVAGESFEEEGSVPVKRRSRPSDTDKQVVRVEPVEGDSQEVIWHVASPEPEEGVRPGTEQFPCRVVNAADRGLDEPNFPVLPPPTFLLDSSSSEGLEDLLSRPVYLNPKAPSKPLPPRPKPTGQSPTTLYHNLQEQIIEEAVISRSGLDASSSSERLAMSHEDGQLLGQNTAEITDIVEDLLGKLVLEAFPKGGNLVPALNFRQLDSGSVSRQESERLERYGPSHIADYLSLVFSKVTETRLKAALGTSITLDPVLILGQLQDIEQGPLISVEPQLFPILPVDVYLELDEGKDESSRNDMTPSTKDIIRDSRRYHNRLLFDAANEALHSYRPYGLKGAPLPWSKSIRSLTPLPPSSSALQMMIQKELVDWSAYEVGKIPEGPLLNTAGQVNEELLQQIREEKLSFMLTKEILENDQIWTDYEPEETQVKIDLADMILEQLMDEIEAICRVSDSLTS